VRWIRANRDLDEWAAQQASSGRQGDSLDPRQQEAILDAFWTYQRAGDPSSTTVVLASPGARAPLRDLLAREVSDVRVLAETDLPPGMNIEDAEVLPFRDA
jgi:flagellar biosynthesis component FlhA